MPDEGGLRKMRSCPFIRRAGQRHRSLTQSSRWGKEAYVTEMPADPGLNLEFVDEALNLVRDAEAKGIRLRILGSIAYRLQCPNNLNLFQDTKRVLTDVDFGAEKKQNKAIREFLVARGYIPDEGIYMASEGARHAYFCLLYTSPSPRDRS